MKTVIRLKEFSELSSSSFPAEHPRAPMTAESPAPPPIERGETPENSSAMMPRPYATPFVSAIAYDHWGINE
jgi:hypothetical protein